jgi:hypothetical protein
VTQIKEVWLLSSLSLLSVANAVSRHYTPFPMTKHLFISGMACACLLIGLAGCVSQNAAPPPNVQNHGDVPPAPGSAAIAPVSPIETLAPLQ